MSKGCIIAIVVVAVVGVLVVGCIGYGLMKGMKMKPQAESVGQQLYEAIRAKDYDRALSLYDPMFFQQTNRDEWRKMLAGINTKLGDLVSYEQRGWNINAQTGTGSASGVYVTLTYKVTYAKYPADETLSLFMPAGGSKFTITGHNINSTGLLKG
jgi:hypothetical protein